MALVNETDTLPGNIHVFVRVTCFWWGLSCFTPNTLIEAAIVAFVHL